jgi:hypothetical protein
VSRFVLLSLHLVRHEPVRYGTRYSERMKRRMEQRDEMEADIHSDVNPEMHQLNIDADNRIQASHTLFVPYNS